MSIHTKGTSQVREGVLLVDQILSNSATNSTVGVVAFNEMTTAQLAVYNDPASTIVKNTDTGEYIACKNLTRSQLTNQVSQSIPQARIVGRGSSSGTGAPELLILSSQLAMVGTTITTAQLLNLFNLCPANLAYQIGNDSIQSSTQGTVEVSLKSIPVAANALLVNGDNIWGVFTGTISSPISPSGNIRLYINNVQIINFQPFLTPSVSWYLHFSVMRISPNTLSCSATITCSSSATTSGFTNLINIILTPSLAFNVEIRGLVSNALNTLTCSTGLINAARNI